MRNIEIITNILNSYTGIDDFIIETSDNLHYTCFFDDGISINFVITFDMDLKVVAGAVFKRYLDESQSYGMNML